MTTPEIIGLIFAAIAGAFTGLAKVYKWGPFLEEIKPVDAPASPKLPDTAVLTANTPPASSSIQEANNALLWDTPQNAFHSVRVLCDNAGLSVKDKDEICATIYGESEFDNRAVCKNRNAQGEVTSIDVGICQINSYFHCGKGKTFPSTDYVVAHPEEAVKFMIQMFKAGQINLWIAHKNGRYQQFIPKTSRMWKLKVYA